MKLQILLLSLPIIAILLISIIDTVVSDPRDHCDCHYQRDKRGCTIGRGPVQAGFKCRCRISTYFIWTHCVGTKLQCDANEKCSAGCSSKECCLLGGGDCNGY